VTAHNIVAWFLLLCGGCLVVVGLLMATSARWARRNPQEAKTIDDIHTEADQGDPR
jgi:hypothetical protein